jgi:hypothetical protein
LKLISLLTLYLLVSNVFFLNNQKVSAQTPSTNPENHHSRVAEKLVTTALTEQKGYRLLGELCQIGPRLSGSQESLQAIYWAKEKMEELGFDRVILQPVMVPHWERGNVEKAEIINTAHAGKPLNIAALGGSIATPEGGITAEVVEVQTFEELRALGEKARGKIIFFNRPFDQTSIYTFAGYGKTVDQRVEGAIEAAKAGGVAMLVRSVTTKYDNVPHVGTLSYKEDVPKVPAAAIGLMDADFLTAALKKSPDLQVKMELNCRTLEDARSFNVIGDVFGNAYPDEYIVVAGHFDSWDKGDGAHDDGAGCIQALEVPDLFKRLGILPKRTIRCVFYINEENGIRGALEYARIADSLGLRHLAAIESDRGAFTPRGFFVDADTAIIAEINQWLPYLQKAGIEWVRKGGSGVDISYIPNLKAPIGYVPDSQRYFDYHHSENDVYETIHPREFELGSAAMAILTYLLSEEGLESLKIVK